MMYQTSRDIRLSHSIHGNTIIKDLSEDLPLRQNGYDIAGKINKVLGKNNLTP